MRGNESHAWWRSHYPPNGFPIPMRGNEGESVDEALSNHGFPIPMRGNELDGGPAPDGAAWRFQSP